MRHRALRLLVILEWLQRLLAAHRIRISAHLFNAPLSKTVSDVEVSRFQLSESVVLAIRSANVASIIWRQIALLRRLKYSQVIIEHFRLGVDRLLLTDELV